MCLAVPLKVIEINGKEGVGEFEGVGSKIRLDFVPKAQIGDYVLVHAGFAMEIIEARQAEDDRATFSEVLHAFDA